jgi:hypothetical protein
VVQEKSALEEQMDRSYRLFESVEIAKTLSGGVYCLQLALWKVDWMQ